MVSRVEIKKRLMREFSFYQKDLDYFENLLLQNVTNYREIKNIVLQDLKTDWQNLNMDWFIKKLQDDKKPCPRLRWPRRRLRW